MRTDRDMLADLHQMVHPVKLNRKQRRALARQDAQDYKKRKKKKKLESTR